MKFFEELKKRNVYKMATAYAVTSWLILQISDVLGPGLGWDESVTTLLLKVLVVGFPIVLVMAWLYELTPKGFKRTGAYQEDTEDNQKMGQRLNYIIIGLLSIAVCFLLVDKVFFAGNTNSNLQEIVPADSRDFTSSIAVLAFADMSPDKDQQHLSDGISEEILNYLAKFKDLKVISRTSSFAFKGKDVTVDVIGDELGVAYVLEGSVRKAGETYRITVQLIDAQDGAHIWSEAYDRKIEDVLFVQDEIARIVAERLNTDLLRKEPYLRKVDPAAYEWYLKGKTNFAFLRPEMVNIAEQNFLKSIEIDSQFAPSYAGLAGVWIARKQLNLSGYTSEETEPEYTGYIEKSFALDSTHSDVWRWYAAKLAYDYNWEDCEEALKRCLELNPNSAEAYAFNAHYAMMQSNWEKAWSAIDKARELDPMNPTILFFYAAMLEHSGQYDKVRNLLKPLNIEPNFHVYANEGKFDSAIVAIKNMPPINNSPGIKAFLENRYQKEGYEGALNALADSLVSLSDSEQYVPAATITQLYLSAGNKVQTAYWIERMYIKRDPNLPYFAIQHPSKPKWLFEDPRIQGVMKQINLWE